MTGKKIILNCNWILYSIVILPYITPPCLKNIQSVSFLDNILVYVGLVIMGWLILKKYYSIKWPILIVSFSYLILEMASIMQGGFASDALKHGVKVIMLCTYLDAIIDSDSNIEIFMSIVKHYTVFWFVLNCVLMIVYPNGVPEFTLNKNVPFFLYGNVNSTIKYIMPGITCTLIEATQKKRVTVPLIILLMGMGYSFIFVYRQATAIVAILLLVMWYVFRNKWIYSIRKLFASMLAITVFLEITIVVLLNSKIISYLAILFGKNVTFSSRTYLWSNAIELIKKKWLIGYGQQTEMSLRKLIGNKSGAHNYYLDLLFQRGILGALPFVVIVFLIIIFLKKAVVKESAYIILGVCSSYLLMFIFEPFYNTEYLFMPLFYIALNILIRNKEENYDT